MVSLEERQGQNLGFLIEGGGIGGMLVLEKKSDVTAAFSMDHWL